MRTPELTSTLPLRCRLAAWLMCLIASVSLQALAQTSAGTSLPPAITAEKVRAEDPEVLRALAGWRLESLLGKPLAEVPLEGGQPGRFRAALLRDTVLLEDLLTALPDTPDAATRAIAVLHQIWTDDPACRQQGLWRRFAVGTAVAYAKDVIWWGDSKTPLDPLAMYHDFKTAHAEKKLFACFNSLPAWQMVFVAGTWARPDELQWARADKDVQPYRTWKKVFDSSDLITYQDVNPNNGVSLFTDSLQFYEGHPYTLQSMRQFGGVCGTVARFAVGVAQANGAPSMPSGQPGHCAYLQLAPGGQWLIGNDISGWEQSYEHPGILIPWGPHALFLKLHTDARVDEAAFRKAERLCWLAAGTSGQEKLSLLKEITEQHPLYYPAWRAWIEVLAKDKRMNPIRKWHGLVKPVLKDYSVPLLALEKLSGLPIPQEKRYKIVQVQTGKVLAVEGGSADSGARVVVADDDGSPSQQWRFVQKGGGMQVFNVQSECVLNVTSNSKEPGGAIIIYNATADLNSSWTWVGRPKHRRLKSQSSGLLLDVGEDGKVIQSKGRPNDDNQSWQTVAVP